MASDKKKSLVIVESPAKAKTIAKFLGAGFQVEASIGHIRDLPQGAKEVPEKYKSEPWAYLGVNVQEEFEPIYIVPAEKKKQVSKLQAAVKDAKDLYLATDEDREGEAISWHLHQVLKPKIPVHRLVFHEITREAIQDALKSTRQIDQGMVRAQETRRILDRLYGYDVSQLLWKKVRPKLSAGRVQSVAVRLIVERERDRMAFHEATYFDLAGRFAKGPGQEFGAHLVSYQNRRVPTGKDFDPATGKIKDDQLLLLDGTAAANLRDQLAKTRFQVTQVEVKPFTERPKPPFTTSTLQQEANRKLGFTARRTMQIAQSLYENGYITYMRTDSTNLAQVAIDAARELVQSQYGANFLHPTDRQYSTKVKNAQEAHEAIRPAGHPFQLPEALRPELDRDQFRLFDMIWKRTVASQMADARKKRITVTIEADGAVFQASGTTIEFEGFLRAYVEGSDDPSAELAEQETLLPDLNRGDDVVCKDLESLSHTTQPPARFTEASLTRTLEERGIGRPSTYASIIDTIQDRAYVFKKGNALVPSWTAFAVIRLLEEHLGSLVNYEFTAQMEDYLDAISRNEAEHVRYLKDFYLGDDGDASTAVLAHTGGLKPLLANKAAEIDPRLACSYAIGTPDGGEHPEPIVVRVGRFGPFLEQGERRASIPDDMPPDELSVDKCLELLGKQAAGEEPLGSDPISGKPIFAKNGRYGPYVQLGTNDDLEKKYSSLLKGMELETLTLETALQLLSLPRVLGVNEAGEEIVARNGRFGPYISCGKESRSLPDPLALLTIDRAQALHLLAQPKATRGGRGISTPKPPLKTLAESPVTGKLIQVLDGRYGQYLSDGETNATLPKDIGLEDLTFEQALELLAARAAMGTAKKKKGARSATKSTATKSTSKKKAVAKTAAAKKAPATKKSSAPKKSVKKGAKATSRSVSAAGQDDIPWDE
jgi:DNA topoisomerase-1